MVFLVTGGAGYIGSNTVVELLSEGHDVVIVDNLYNSHQSVIHDIETITGKKVKFYDIDLCCEADLTHVFLENQIECCIHFAAYKAVAESVYMPLEYYRNNILSTLTLLNVMKKCGVKKFIYSSSACVYGDSPIQPITENCPIGECVNPYGWTKVMNEQIIRDFARVEDSWHIVLLRYFNPVGANSGALLGDNPKGIPNNLMPYLTQVALGILPELRVYGGDYDTKDGTCVRDFVHVVDIARGHLSALKVFDRDFGLYVYNLGTGIPHTILEVIDTFERVNGLKLNYRVVERRVGDVAVSYANPSKANMELNWKATKNLEEMCRDSWNFMKNANK